MILLTFREILKIIWEASFHNPLIFLFIVSIAGNAVPFTSLPYLFIVVVIARIVAKDPLTYLAIILVSVAGASIGKLVIYSIGRFAHHRASEETKDNLRYLSSKIGLYGFILILIAASTPIPDDIINLPAGFAGYNLLHYSIAVFIGKIIITALALFLGIAVLESLETLGLGLVASTLLFLLISLYVSYLLARINWRYVFEEDQQTATRERIKKVAEKLISKAYRTTKELFLVRNLIKK
ncbi:MAG: VTT domain-containing protein [Sulfolobales archaeon]